MNDLIKVNSVFLEIGKIVWLNIIIKFDRVIFVIFIINMFELLGTVKIKNSKR